MAEAAAAISATEPDWSRERLGPGEWNPGKRLLAAIRAYQRARSPFGRKLAALRHRWWSAISGADIPLSCRIGGGLLMPHPNGIVLHPSATIGPNCLIFQQVTLGTAVDLAPQIGGHVDIGAGAKLLGPITVGDHALIGANAVVLADVPSGATAVGIPARIVG
jgi:serine O-acetyltransferase